MGSFALVVVLLVGVVPAAVGQDVSSQVLPRVVLSLPPGVASETVQINYFMRGPFGGYGGFVRTKKNRRTYDIDASVDGHAANGMKVIAYLPGCEIVTLDFPLQGTIIVEQQLPCRPLKSISLHGQIFPVSITQEQPTEVEVLYLAMWAHQFFGMFDGTVTTIRIATIVPDDDGRFDVKLPDLSKQTELGDGEFQFLLRQLTSGNIIAFLRPAEPGSSVRHLKVRPAYAPLVQFVAERQ